MRIARGSEGGGKREPLASGKPHPILPAGAASNDAQNVRDECAKDVTARRDGHTTRKAARTMSARDSLCASLDKAVAPMHHFTGTLTQPFGEHDDTCPGCALQDLAGALETALSAFYKVDAPACARLCDEVLDTSGALLGRVRIWVENRKGNDG